MITGKGFNNIYFNCVKEAINSKCLEVRKFPLKFDLMNTEVNRLGCYSK